MSTSVSTNVPSSIGVKVTNIYLRISEISKTIYMSVNGMDRLLPPVDYHRRTEIYAMNNGFKADSAPPKELLARSVDSS